MPPFRQIAPPHPYHCPATLHKLLTFRMSWNLDLYWLTGFVQTIKNLVFWRSCLCVNKWWTSNLSFQNNYVESITLKNFVGTLDWTVDIRCSNTILINKGLAVSIYNSKNYTRQWNDLAFYWMWRRITVVPLESFNVSSSKNGPSSASFCLFRFFSNNLQNINCRLQRDSNLDRWSRRRAR